LTLSPPGSVALNNTAIWLALVMPSDPMVECRTSGHRPAGSAGWWCALVRDPVAHEEQRFGSLIVLPKTIVPSG
jgi:hypothetical protein